MGAIADVGLLKMDFLGLTNLTIIGKTIELIEEMNGINFDIYSISKEDKNTFDLIGWQNTDIYQNFNITFLSSIRKNRVISKNIFKLPTQN